MTSTAAILILTSLSGHGCIKDCGVATSKMETISVLSKRQETRETCVAMAGRRNFLIHRDL
jgi:hypothetical protein